MAGPTPYDEIGYWSEIKLDIVREYAGAYSRILSAQTKPRLHHIYVDAFAGSGLHLSRTSGDMVPGSPLNALQVEPPFMEYHFIDLDRDKADSLRTLTGRRRQVYVYEADCNQVLLDEVFPRALFEQYRRALCLLDPYGLHLDWRVIEQAGRMKSVDLFLNFPVADMNRNVLWVDPREVSADQEARMTRFWGDGSWREALYVVQGGLFGSDQELKVSHPNDRLVAAFRERLRRVAGFREVPEPIPMRNSIGRIVYYLFFASQKSVAAHIIRDIFRKYRTRGVL